MLDSLAGDVAAICRSPAVDPELALILSRVFLIILGLWIHLGCASFGRTLRRAVMVYEQEGATFWCACAFTSTKKVKDMQVQSIISTFPLYIYTYIWVHCDIGACKSFFFGCTLGNMLVQSLLQTLEIR